ncbi:unnamed protein product, partial [Closterium sp. NIES-53]
PSTRTLLSPPQIPPSPPPSPPTPIHLLRAHYEQGSRVPPSALSILDPFLDRPYFGHPCFPLTPCQQYTFHELIVNNPNAPAPFPPTWAALVPAPPHLGPPSNTRSTSSL